MDRKATVTRFNQAINDGDVGALAALMTEDHVFVDASGDVTEGKERCLGIWRTFFEQFPDYENVFTSMRSVGDRVTVTGRSNCTDERLDGPALWTAEVRGERVAGWRVYEDTTENRRLLGVADDAE